MKQSRKHKRFDSGPLHIERLSSQGRVFFESGNAALDGYLKTQASQDEKRHVASCYVLIDSSTKRVAGYYTLSAAGVDPEALPRETTRRLPRYAQIPATLIGRLALDQKYQGKSLGSALLHDAIRRCYVNSASVASVLVMVHAIDERARAFYLRFGFNETTVQRMHLFMPMQTVKKLIQQQ